jgi:hypothetical protein
MIKVDRRCAYEVLWLVLSMDYGRTDLILESLLSVVIVQ